MPISTAARPMIGQLLGAGHNDRACEVYRQMINLSTGVAIVLAGSLLAGNYPFISSWVGASNYGGLAMDAFLTDTENETGLNEMLERQMNSFLVSYANYYNNRYDRKGGLFQKPFRRIEISDDTYLQQAIIYTNANAQKHHIINDFSRYPHSSYQDLIHDRGTWLARTEVIDFFGSKEKFEELHKAQVEYYYTKGWPSSNLE